MTTSELLQALDLSTFISLDLETTGLNPDTDAIIEISAYRFTDGEPDQEFSALVKPPFPIPPEIVDLTGITNKLVSDSKPIQDVLPGLLEFIGTSRVVGHNISFDLRFIELQCKRLNIEFTPPISYDTLPLSRGFLFFHHQFNLGGVSEFFGLSAENAHRAGADTLNTGKIFTELVWEAASYPLPVLDTVYNTVKHSSIHNLQLFQGLVDFAVQNRMVDGIVSSRIPKEFHSFVFRHTPETAKDYPSQPDEWFQEDGILQQEWKGYEIRGGQIAMCSDSFKAFTDDALLVAEAGTGLGKSAAYLSSGMLYSHHTDIPLVVSTYTKNLQDQLFFNDIPSLAKILDIPVNAVLLKGRQNYLCKTRLNWVLQNSEGVLSPDDCNNIISVIIWNHHTQTGDINECPGFPLMNAGKLWARIRSEAGYCTTQRCHEHDGCFLGPIRKAANSANILVINHAFLISDLIQNSQTLPSTFVYTIDEAHNLENAVKDQMIQHVSRSTFDDVCSFFIQVQDRYRHELKEIIAVKPELESVVRDLTDDAAHVQKQALQFFKGYVSVKEKQLNEQHLRYEQVFVIENAQSEFARVEPSPQDLCTLLPGLRQNADALLDKLNDLGLSSDNNLALEFQVHISKLDNLITVLDRILATEDEDVVWSSFTRFRDTFRITMRCAPRDVSGIISDLLFKRECGGLICSATLTVNARFDYLKDCIGLSHLGHMKDVRERIYSSPFHYHDQLQLFSFQSNININSPRYFQEIADQIDKFTHHIHRRMLVLCTSYAQTQQLKDLLYPRIHKTNRRLFVQTMGANRLALIRGYLENKRSILIGTASFWEGVDLPGDKVEVLLILKVPFANPTDPLVIAKSQVFSQRGKNAFHEFSVPDAIVRMKQGFGRLIRSMDDEGICLLTDPRLQTARYGKTVLKSFPVEAVSYMFIDAVIFSARNFFHRE